MITPEYVRTLSRYNAWQNRSLAGAADSLDEAARVAERGAFFGSIAGTLNHVLWADRIWMNRLAGAAPPVSASIADSVTETADWPAYRAARTAMDDRIIAWADTLAADALAGELSWYSVGARREICRPRWLLVTHLFNHQTHHRGQVHALLTAAGARPGDTDLSLMPADTAGA